MKRFLSTVMAVSVILLFAAVSASAADEPDYVLVGETFDSGSYLFRDASYPTGNAYVATSQVVPGSSSSTKFRDYDPGLFASPPVSMVTYGSLFGSYRRWSVTNDSVSTSIYELDLSQYNMFAGRTYRFQVGNFVERHGYVPDASNGPQNPQYHSLVKVNFYVDGSSVEQKQLVSYVPPSGHIVPGVLLQYGSGEMFFDFEMPDSQDVQIQLWVQRYLTAVGVYGQMTYTSAGFDNWFGFEDAGIYAVVEPDPDEEFKDEQRGFWANALAWFQKIWDAIMSIPTMIANFFKQVWDVLRMIGEWIMTLLRLLGKAVQYFALVLGFLPWWMFAAVTALVAVCVIYKILGRESAG